MAEIRYYNRYSGREEVEEVYGEAFLRWTYETAPGRTSLWAVARRPAFSRWYGWRMSRAASSKMIKPFIEKYNLDTAEFLDSVSTFSSFNEFFYRKLKSDARPILGSETAVALPADGRHLGLASLDEVDGLYAKGQRFNLAAFLGDEDLAKSFKGGTAVISRLCPVDYHRFHAPVSGRIVKQRLINGWLYSVSPIALRRNAAYLWENKRVMSLIESDQHGKVAFVAIGATCVGTIGMSVLEGGKVARGEELGFFAFGGSCVVTLFEAGRVDLAPDLVENGAMHREVYAKVGDVLGEGV